MFPTQNSLPEQIRGQSIDLLNKHLAAAIDLHAQLKQAHWNVRGPAFIAIHELFDRISVEAEAMSDVIAERVGGLGGVAKGTLQVAAERSFLPPYLLGVGQEEMHLGAIAAALAAFGTSVRGAIGEATAFGDVDTADLFTEVSRTTDKQLWFIESHNVPA